MTNITKTVQLYQLMIITQYASITLASDSLNLQANKIKQHKTITFANSYLSL